MEKSERKSSGCPKNVFRGSPGESLRKLLGEANGALQDAHVSVHVSAFLPGPVTHLFRDLSLTGEIWKKKLGHCDTKKKKINFIRIKKMGNILLLLLKALLNLQKNKTS